MHEVENIYQSGTHNNNNNNNKKTFIIVVHVATTRLVKIN